MLPETDLRDQHGPDFRLVNSMPYRVAGLDLLALPMTRADLGPLSRWWRLRAWLDTQTASLLHVRAFLARARLLERLTLTPGVSAPDRRSCCCKPFCAAATGCSCCIFTARRSPPGTRLTCAPRRTG
jgi:hypothetical protein